MALERFSKNESLTPPVDQFGTIQTYLIMSTRKHLLPNSWSMKKIKKLIGILNKRCGSSNHALMLSYNQELNIDKLFMSMSFLPEEKGWIRQFVYFAKQIYLFLNATKKNCVNKNND